MAYNRPRNPDEIPDEEELVPLPLHLDQQINALEHRLQVDPPTDPNLLARFERDLEGWKRQRRAADDPDWGAGRGDRTLF